MWEMHTRRVYANSNVPGLTRFASDGGTPGHLMISGLLEQVYRTQIRHISPCAIKIRFIHKKGLQIAILVIVTLITFLK